MASSSSSPPSSSSIIQITLLLLITSTLTLSSDIDPKPKEWPEQFHSILVMNYSGDLQLIDLWYDWPNGRNFNIIQYQLGKVLYDLEWNNGTSFFYTLDDSNPECSSAQLEVGILRPNWLDGATYLGRQQVNGFVCNVWTKADFITYYEDVVTKRPVSWAFYTGRTAHVMTFEVGAALEDAKWQVPSYCFNQNGAATSNDNDGINKSDSVLGFTSDVLQQFTKDRSTTIGTVMHKALQAYRSMKAVNECRGISCRIGELRRKLSEDELLCEHSQVNFLRRLSSWKVVQRALM